jgi:hypothetical protein
MPRYAWLVVFFAFLGFTTSLVIHIAAYFKLFPAELFLFYCRAEWVGVALVAFLLGIYMPTTHPRRQLLMLLRWMVVACGALFLYIVYCGGLYIVSEHPRKAEGHYALMRRNLVVRRLTRAEYMQRSTQERNFYMMSLNRAFSLVWVILFFGIGVYGVGYLRTIRRLGLYELSGEKYVPWWYVGG